MMLLPHRPGIGLGVGFALMYLLVFVPGLRAQSFATRILIQDEEGFPLARASVSVWETSKLLVTDGSGHCTCLVSEGIKQLNLIARCNGYVPVTKLLSVGEDCVIILKPIREDTFGARILRVAPPVAAPRAPAAPSDPTSPPVLVWRIIPCTNNPWTTYATPHS